MKKVILVVFLTAFLLPVKAFSQEKEEVVNEAEPLTQEEINLLEGAYNVVIGISDGFSSEGSPPKGSIVVKEVLKGNLKEGQTLENVSAGKTWKNRKKYSNKKAIWLLVKHGKTVVAWWPDAYSKKEQQRVRNYLKENKPEESTEPKALTQEEIDLLGKAYHVVIGISDGFPNEGPPPKGSIIVKEVLKGNLKVEQTLENVSPGKTWKNRNKYANKKAIWLLNKSGKTVIAWWPDANSKDEQERVRSYLRGAEAAASSK